MLPWRQRQVGVNGNGSDGGGGCGDGGLVFVDDDADADDDATYHIVYMAMSRCWSGLDGTPVIMDVNKAGYKAERSERSLTVLLVTFPVTRTHHDHMVAMDSTVYTPMIAIL
jgi:hypothetical protein